MVIFEKKVEDLKTELMNKMKILALFENSVCYCFIYKVIEIDFGNFHVYSTHIFNFNSIIVMLLSGAIRRS